MGWDEVRLSLCYSDLVGIPDADGGGAGEGGEGEWEMDGADRPAPSGTLAPDAPPGQVLTSREL